MLLGIGALPRAKQKQQSGEINEEDLVNAANRRASIFGWDKHRYGTGRRR